jgi:hypothetical protein
MKHYIIGFTAGCCEVIGSRLHVWSKGLLDRDRTKSLKDGFDRGADLFTPYGRYKK